MKTRKQSLIGVVIRTILARPKVTPVVSQVNTAGNSIQSADLKISGDVIAYNIKG